MRPTVVEISPVLTVKRTGILTSFVSRYPNYKEASLGGDLRVAAVGFKHRVKYEYRKTARPGCSIPADRVYRRTEFTALEKPPACYPLSAIYDQKGPVWELLRRQLLDGIIDPDELMGICRAVRQSVSTMLRSGGENVLVLLELETTKVLTYDGQRGWNPDPRGELPLPPRSDPARHPLEKLGMERYVADEEQGTETCAICFEDFVPGMEVERLPCRHRFHGECVWPWLEESGSCPLCRSIAFEEEYY